MCKQYGFKKTRARSYSYRPVFLLRNMVSIPFNLSFVAAFYFLLSFVMLFISFCYFKVNSSEVPQLVTTRKWAVVFTGRKLSNTGLYGTFYVNTAYCACILPLSSTFHTSSKKTTAGQVKCWKSDQTNAKFTRLFWNFHKILPSRHVIAQTNITLSASNRFCERKYKSSRSA